VAISALALAVQREIERLRIQALDYEIRAAYHGLVENLRSHAREFDGRYVGCRSSVRFRANPQLDPRLAAWHAALRRKYEDAASRPWLPVKSDPPEPK